MPLSQKWKPDLARFARNRRTIDYISQTDVESPEGLKFALFRRRLNGQRTKVPFISRNSPYSAGRLARYSIPPVAHSGRAPPRYTRCTHQTLTQLCDTHTHVYTWLCVKDVRLLLRTHVRTGAECGAINTENGDLGRPRRARDEQGASTGAPV